jgi:threonine synthase
MIYHSLKDRHVKAKFGEALLASLTPDGGLWMPDTLPVFDDEAQARLGAMSFADCAAALARHFVDDSFSNEALTRICRDAYDFEMPLRTVNGRVMDAAMPEAESAYFLELFHGPTLAFKDYAARFMGRAASHIMSKSGAKRTILVATSGDTGGAIGDAFLDQAGINVFILFPKGGVSKVQEQQLTTMGRRGCNVRAIAVDGTFDACQALVKQAFGARGMNKKYNLMSANSINVGRVIPQSFYYFWSSLQIRAAHPGLPIVYSIPSGNLGNLTGGLIARKMGAPISKFVIGNNANDPFVDYLETGEYQPRDSIPTLSNAMDIGRPNNFPRVVDLFGGDYDAVKDACWGASFSDQETERHMRRIHMATGYVMCPHTAVGHLAMQAYSEDKSRPFIQVTVATAHPAKFNDSVERILHESQPMPPVLASAMRRKPRVHVMPPELGALDAYLAAHA